MITYKPIITFNSSASTAVCSYDIKLLVSLLARFIEHDNASFVPLETITRKVLRQLLELDDMDMELFDAIESDTCPISYHDDIFDTISEIANMFETIQTMNLTARRLIVTGQVKER